MEGPSMGSSYYKRAGTLSVKLMREAQEGRRRAFCEAKLKRAVAIYGQPGAGGAASLRHCYSCAG